jgi:hypothetical protein
MDGIRPRVILHLGLHCREPTGRDLTAYLRRATPFYQSISGVNVRLLRSLDRPGRFTEIIEYATDEAFQADKVRISDDQRMQGFLAEWRELLVEPPEVEHFVDITAEIAKGAKDA